MSATKAQRVRRLGGALPPLIALVGAVTVALSACQSADAPPRTITFTTLNESGVAGTVSFRAVGSRSEVSVSVSPGGNPDMPAHIHPGTCDNLTPQPKFPLENVREGASITVVPATVDELFAGGLAVDVHKSNDDLRTYTACVDIH